MDLQAVSEGLAAVVAAALPDVNCFAASPDSVTVPCFYVYDISGSYDQTFGGMDDLLVTCRILVESGDDLDAQAALKAYLGRGARSLKLAIEGTPGVAQTLGGACDDVHVRRFQGYRMYEHQDSRFFGAELLVRVIGDPEE